MALFQKKIGPIFLKEESDAANFIDRMEEIGKKSSGDLKNKIDEQIKLARYGIAGENNIAFELKNSGIDMYILHDIYLEYEDLSAQIDYMIFTRKHIYVIECKNLIGINSNFAFHNCYYSGFIWKGQFFFGFCYRNFWNFNYFLDVYKKEYCSRNKKAAASFS